MGGGEGKVMYIDIEGIFRLERLLVVVERLLNFFLIIINFLFYCRSKNMYMCRIINFFYLLLC